jgi:hypothetical protein
MNNPVKGFYVKNKQTGEIKFAVYTKNRLGNLRMHVEGRSYNDKYFAKKFEKFNS